MRGTSLRFFAISASCAALLVGCEWTSSDGESSWSNKYDDMNFAGTYRVGVVVDEEQTEDPRPVSVSEKVGTYGPNIGLSYGGKLNANVVPNSLGIRFANDYSYADDGSGVLVGGSPDAGSGTIRYDSGAWAVTLNTVADTGDIIAVYSYIPSPSGGGSDGTAVTAFAVSHTGENLTIRTNTGITMTGKFGSVKAFTGVDGTTPTGYNAQFEVSSSGNKFVGTLDSTGTQRTLNGIWISNGTIYDVSGVAAGAIQAGGAATAN